MVFSSISLLVPAVYAPNSSFQNSGNSAVVQSAHTGKTLTYITPSNSQTPSFKSSGSPKSFSGNKNPGYLSNTTLRYPYNFSISGSITASAFDFQEGALYELGYANPPSLAPCGFIMNGTSGDPIIGGPLPVKQAPISLAFEPNGTGFMGFSDNSSILFLNQSVLGFTLNLSGNFSSLSIAPDYNSGNVYVASLNNSGTYQVSIINLTSRTVLKNISIGSYDLGHIYPANSAAVYDPQNGLIYVGGYGGNFITVINTTTQSIAQNITVSSNITSLALDSLNGYLYAGSAESGNISVVNTATDSVLATVNVGMNVSQPLFDPINGFVYAIGLEGNLTVINGATNMAIESVHTSPGIYATDSIDPFNGNLILDGVNLSGGYTSVTEIPTAPGTVLYNSTLSSLLPFTCLALPPTYDPVNGKLVMGDLTGIACSFGNVYYNPFNNTVSGESPIVPGGFTNPCGFYSGVINSTGMVYILNQTGIILFYGNNLSVYKTVNLGPGVLTGKYSYSYKPVYDPVNGNIYAIDTNESHGNIAVVNVTTGIVTGNISIANYSHPTLSANTNNGDVYVTNDSGQVGIIKPGTNKISELFNFSFNITYSTFDPQNQYLYLFNATTSVLYTNIIFFNTSSSKIVGYLNNSVSSIPMAQDFNSNYSTLYYLECSPVQAIVGINTHTGQQALQYNLSERAEVWGFTYDPTTTNLYVTYCCDNISAVQSNVPLEYGYNVLVSGLPAGDTWYLNLSNGQSFSSDTSSISLQELPGTYSYTLSTSSNSYVFSSSRGSFTVGSAPASSSPVSASKTYYADFTETGLPSGTAWNITTSGHEYSTSHTGSTESIQMANGSYTYTVSLGNIPYYLNDTSSSFQINGSGVNVQLKFSEYSHIYGMVSPGNATMTINGNSVALTNGAFNVTEKAGTYNVTISADGYKTVYSNFTLGNGVNKNLSENLTLTNTGTAPGPNKTLLYAAAGGVAVLAVGAGGYMFMRRPRK